MITFRLRKVVALRGRVPLCVEYLSRLAIVFVAETTAIIRVPEFIAQLLLAEQTHARQYSLPQPPFRMGWFKGSRFLCLGTKTHFLRKANQYLSTAMAPTTIILMEPARPSPILLTGIIWLRDHRIQFQSQQ